MDAATTERPRWKRKRMRRKGQARAQRSAHCDEGAEASKRQRSAPEERLAPGDETDETTTTESATTSDCQYVEMAYMGSTRAVVGPGFRVHELLFDGKTWEEPSFVQATEAVDSITGNPESLTEESLAVPSQPQRLKPPAVFTRSTMTGFMSATWATGVSTGGATLTFPNVSVANTFIESISAEEFDLPSNITVALLGFLDDDDQSIEEREHEQRVKELMPLYPPLTIVHSNYGTRKSALLFDELKINMMSAPEICGLRFLAQIASGLPPDVDEVELVEILHPLPCDVVVHRKANTPSSHEPQCAVRPSVPLQSCLTVDEVLRSCEDHAAKKAGVRVDSVDLQRLAEVEERARQSPMWTSMETPCGQPVRVAVTFEFRTTMGLDRSNSFDDKLNEVRLLAQANNVSWTNIRASPDATHVEFVLRSSSRDAVERMHDALEGVVESVPFSDPMLAATFKSQSKWKSLVKT